MSYTCFTPYILCQSFPCLLPVCFSRHPVLFLVLPARLPACPEPGFLPAPFGPCFCEPFLLIKECFFVIAFCVPACLSAPEPHPITKTCQILCQKEVEHTLIMCEAYLCDAVFKSLLFYYCIKRVKKKPSNVLCLCCVTLCCVTLFIVS
ncbi:hypothetical protein EYF80_017190 [Liparis tanakae]|uniref:Uncharacterized protein n=1 Tax=Liparis tanakae TaxID=230148 RepID=A0A4Z2I5S5_9TELE|nr:hypothetical protein EYF80_017190 [Liparis tanakae]